MALTRWDPFQEMMSLREAMDRLFEESFIRPRERYEVSGRLPLRMDVIEHDDDYEVRASLPGIKPEDVDVTIRGNTINVRAECKEERKEENYLLRERRLGTFFRSITLAVPLDAEHAEARFENGVLALSVPKAAEAKPKKIELRATQAIGKGEQVREAGKQS